MDSPSCAAAGLARPNPLDSEGPKTLMGLLEAPVRLAHVGTQEDMHVLASLGHLGGDHPGDKLRGVEPLRTPKKGSEPLHLVQSDVQFCFGDGSGEASGWFGFGLG